MTDYLLLTLLNRRLSVPLDLSITLLEFLKYHVPLENVFSPHRLYQLYKVIHNTITMLTLFVASAGAITITAKIIITGMTRTELDSELLI